MGMVADVRVRSTAQSPAPGPTGALRSLRAAPNPFTEHAAGARQDDRSSDRRDERALRTRRCSVSRPTLSPYAHESCSLQHCEERPLPDGSRHSIGPFPFPR
jgi:hypothetical protein